MRFLLTTILIIFTQGCIPHSDKPLTDPEQETIDAAIMGTWFWNEEGETGYVHIGFDDESKLLRVIMLDTDRENRLDESEFLGHTSSIDGNRYLNLKYVRPAQTEITGYLFIKYTADANALGIAIMDRKLTETMIINGSLKGQVNQNDMFAPVHITDDQIQLQEFVRQNDKELFTEMKYLQKLYLPEFNYGEQDTE